MIKHILFDCDGVLVDTEITAANVMVKALQQLGTDISINYFMQHYSGATFSAILDIYLPTIIGNERIQFIHTLEQEIVKKVSVIKGTSKMLASIKLPKSIVSNSEIWQVKEEVEKTGIDHYFTGHIFSSELVENPKPAPDVYNLAVKKLGLKKTEVLVVEDSITGATAALAARLKVIGFAGASHILPGHSQKMLEIGVFKVAGNMKELEEIIAHLAPS